MQKRLVWDLPVRAFHWTLVALVGSAWVSAETGLNSVHRWTGYAILALILFRVLWGLVGSDNARFSHFMQRPSAAWAYARNMLGGSNPHYDSHNPAGGWMVVALLLALLLQVVTGLFANDELLFEGPFMPLVGSQWSEWITEIHEANFNILIGLVVLHVAAVGLHELFGERLVKAMFDGHKDSNGAPTRIKPLWLALLLLAAAAGAVWWLLSLAPPPAVGF